MFWLHLLNECSDLQFKHESTACLHHKSKHYVHGLLRFTYWLKVIQILPVSPLKGILILHWLSEVVTDVKSSGICRGTKLLILRGTSNWHLKWSFPCVLHHDRKLFICLLPPGFSQSVPFFLHPFQLKNDSLVALKDHTCKRWGQIQLVINTVNSA